MRRYLLISISLVLVFLCLLIVLSAPHTTPLPENQRQDVIRVCAANLNYENRHPGEATSALVKTNTDFLVLLEWTGKNALPSVFEKNGFKMVLSAPRNGTHGVAILCKKRINVKAAVIQSPISGPCRLPFGVARLKFNGKAFTIIAVHAPPPVSSCKDGNEKTLGAIGSWIKNGKLRFNLGPGVKGDDVVLLGDYNATVFSKGWSSLMKTGVRDAMRSGWRLKPTLALFKSVPSMIRIDYVFVGNGFVPMAAYTIRIKDSDHRAVISDVQTRSVSGGDPE